MKNPNEPAGRERDGPASRGLPSANGATQFAGSRGVDFMVLGGVLAAISELYLATTSPYVVGEDNGEFSAIYAHGGVAHPSGYPLYTLLLRAFAWLPADTPARGAGLVTAAIGLGAVALLYRACRAWSAGPAAAALASVAFGTAPVAWDLATKAEVFALNAALAAAIILVGAPAGPVRGNARAAWTGLLFGLGVSNHHTVVLLAPLGVWSLFASLRESSTRARAALLCCAAFAAGLLPYATLPLAARSSSGWVWGDVTSWHGVVAHFLRRDFGTTRLAVGSAHPSLLGNLGALARTLFVDLRGVGCVVGLGVLAVALVRAAGDRRRRTAETPSSFALAALAASFLFAGPVFAAFMNIELSPEGHAIERRFHLLPLLLLCVPFSLGADLVLPRVRAPLRVAAVGTALLAGAALGFTDVRDEHGPMLEHYVIDTLQTAPPDAVLFGSGDVRVFGVLYAQLGLGLRRDVVFVSPILLNYDWYRRRAEAELGVALPSPVRGSVDTVALAECVLAAGRRLFLTDVFSRAIPASFATYPLGTLIEVLPRGGFAPSAAELEQQNLAAFEKYRIDGELLDVTRAWSHGPREAYERPWAALARVYAARGDAAGAARNAHRAATLEPWVTQRP